MSLATDLMDKDQPLTVKCVAKKKYGRWLIYPSCAMSELLTRLTGKLTLSPDNLNTIEALGFVIEWVTEAQVDEELKQIMNIKETI